MKLYTKTGDDGTTGLFGGARVPKHDPRVTAYGEVDELNAVIGMVIAGCIDDQTADTVRVSNQTVPDRAKAPLPPGRGSVLSEGLRQIQSELFILGAELATPDATQAPSKIEQVHVVQLERWIDAAADEVPPLKNFVLPGGTTTAARLHLARTVCRRAERAVVALAETNTVRPWVVVYLNRLSDLLFALARAANHRAGVADIPWTAPRT